MEIEKQETINTQTKIVNTILLKTLYVQTNEVNTRKQ